MASAAEQMASNMSWGAFGKATELRQRILFTLGLLIVYRLGTFIPVPGIDGAALRSFMEEAQSGIGGILSMFTGGALSRMGIFALGIMPYISASIVIQLLSTMYEPLKALKKEGEQGRRKINQYTRYLTVIVATAQAFGLAASLEAGGLASDPGIFFQASCIITIVGGCMFCTFSGGSTSPIMSTILAYFGPGQPLYLIFFSAMIIFFTYFYTKEVAFKTEDVAENLKNQNGFVPGIRPGKKTQDYLDYVVNRILVLGSGYLALVALMPEIIRAQLSIPFYFGGTSILIIVSVGMDTIQQIQSHLLAHQYEGLIEKSQLRGKRGGAKRKGPSRR